MTQDQTRKCHFIERKAQAHVSGQLKPKQETLPLLSDVSDSAAAEEAMALAAALARAATRLLRGGLPPSATSPALSSRSRLLCSLPADNEPSSPGAVEVGETWKEAEAEILRDIEPVVKRVKDILHSGR